MKTSLDIAVADMQAAPDDVRKRMRFFDLLSGTELFLMLEAEPTEDKISPSLFKLSTGPVALAFDTEARLADFAQKTQSFAALSGRRLAGMLASQGIGLGLNIGAPSEVLVSVEELEWLITSIDESPVEDHGSPTAVLPASGLPETLITALDARLTGMQGLARMAYLARMEFNDGRRTHALAFIDAMLPAQGAMAQSVQDALTFSGLEAATLDVMFLQASDKLAADLARVGLRFDLPQPSAPTESRPPGTDPDQPPKLR